MSSATRKKQKHPQKKDEKFLCENFNQKKKNDKRSNHIDEPVAVILSSKCCGTHICWLYYVMRSLFIFLFFPSFDLF